MKLSREKLTAEVECVMAKIASEVDLIDPVIRTDHRLDMALGPLVKHTWNNVNNIRLDCEQSGVIVSEAIVYHVMDAFIDIGLIVCDDAWVNGHIGGLATCAYVSQESPILMGEHSSSHDTQKLDERVGVRIRSGDFSDEDMVREVDDFIDILDRSTDLGEIAKDLKSKCLAEPTFVDKVAVFAMCEIRKIRPKDYLTDIPQISKKRASDESSELSEPRSSKRFKLSILGDSVELSFGNIKDSTDVMDAVKTLCEAFADAE